MKKIFEKHRELIVYVIVGGLTTLVNYAIHFSMRFLGINYYFSLSGAWLGAVLFAYFANRIFVFESKAKGKSALREFALFIGARVLSYGIELLLSYILIDLAHADRFVFCYEQTVIPIGELVVKTLCQIFIIVSNYIFSKFVIFRKEN